MALANTIFYDDFSGGYPGSWSIGHDGGSGTYAWAWPNGYAHCYSNPSGGQYYYPNNLKVYMERRGVSLVGYERATLSFYKIVDTEQGYDFFTVNIRDQAGVWHEIHRSSGLTDPLNWQYVELSLDGYAGQSGLYIQFRFDSDGSISGSPYDGVFVDNVQLTAQPVTKGNLTYYAPSGWDYPIVPSSVSGTHSVSTLYSEQNTYIDWAIINNGSKDVTSTFYTALYIDNSFVTDWYTSTLYINYYTYVEDYVRTLATGWHSLKIITDYLNQIDESNESDNTYERSFYWEAPSKPNLLPYAMAGWDYPVVPSSITGTHTVNTLNGDQVTYIDWGVYNNGSQNATRFHTALYVDGNFVTSWDHSSGLSTNSVAYVEDFERTLPPGYHTLKIVADYLGEVSEQNESDNSYERQFYWTSPGTVTVTGWIRYHNHNPYEVHDARGLVVEVWDRDLTSLDDLLWSGSTDNNGHFTSEAITNSELLQGTQDLYVRIYSQNVASNIKTGVLGSTYALETQPIDNVSDGTLDLGLMTPPYDYDAPFFIADKLLDGYNQWRYYRQSYDPGDVVVVWDATQLDGTYYNDILNFIQISAENNAGEGRPDSFDDGVILHEYGHRLEDIFNFFDASEGGDHMWTDRKSLGLAASEGFAHAWSSIVRGNSRQYNYWLDASGSFSHNYWVDVENGEHGGGSSVYGSANDFGNTCEASVAGMFWDIFDAVDDDYNHDGIGDVMDNFVHSLLSTVLDRTVNGHRPDNSDDFWDAWFAAPSLGHQAEMGAIWYEHGNDKIGLPIELVSFSATVVDRDILLDWKTATEVNNYGFEIERRSIGDSSGQWNKIGFIAGSGSSNSPHEYSFSDHNVFPGRYAYRIKQIDRDGSFKYYGNAEVEIIAPSTFALEQNYPNPFNPSTVIRYALPSRSVVRLEIFNALGQRVQELVNSEQDAGYREVTWQASISSGLYFYRIEAIAIDNPQKRFVETKKLILLR